MACIANPAIFDVEPYDNLQFDLTNILDIDEVKRNIAKEVRLYENCEKQLTGVLNADSEVLTYNAVLVTYGERKEQMVYNYLNDKLIY